MTIRQNIIIVNSICEIMKLNPKIIKENEVFNYSYNQIAIDILSNNNLVKWNEISLIDFKDTEAKNKFSETRNVTVDDSIYNIVLDHYLKNVYNTKNKVSFSYLTQLVLLYTRKKLISANTLKRIETQNVNANNYISIIHKIIELMEESSVEANDKIISIQNILNK